VNVTVNSTHQNGFCNDIIVFTSFGTEASIRPAIRLAFFNVARALKRLHTPALRYCLFFIMVSLSCQLTTPDFR
jgi:hypothetical protein